jgi:RecA/RadA recombinase
MRQILHQYKLRLTNLSQANRSLKLGRLSRRRDIDWKNLGFLGKESAEELLQKVIADKDVRLINRLDPRFEPTNLADRRLNQIYREANRIFEETGTYDLFLGYPFVEGRFLDGTGTRCPLLLFPVRLVRNLQSRPRWKLEVIKEESVQFNKTFFLAYEQFQQVRLPEEFWEEEMEPHKDWGEWLQALYEKFKHYELDLNFNARLFERQLIGFPDYKAAVFERWGIGKLTCQPQAVLGIFPQSDSALLQDYQTLETSSADFPVDDLFGDTGETQLNPELPYIKEEQRFFVTPVDQSQEEALLQIKNGRSVVIHGPPGTGKSQVIVNIVADALAHGKKVLVVSQKRAALDVVYKRLGALSLNRFAMLVHDYRHDRAAIYRKLKTQIEDIPAFKREINDLNLTQWEHEYKLLSRQADQFNRQFEELHQALTQEREWGLNVHELYLRSDPHQARLPLEPVSRKLSLSSLKSWLSRVGAVLDYADLFVEGYPWVNRLSFKAYNYEDRHRLAEQLKSIPAQIRALHTTYNTLSKKLSTRILDHQLNEERIAAYRQVNQSIQDVRRREAMEMLHLDRRKPETLHKVLDELAEALDKLEHRKWLDDGDWQFLSELDRHVQNYHKLQEKGLRWLSLAFLRANWFLKRILERHDQELDKTRFQQIRRDLLLYQKVHRIYARHFEKPFFHDFPLLNEQAEKRQWLARKRADLEAYEQLKAITFFRSILPRFEKGTFDMQSWQNSLHRIRDLEQFNQTLRDADRDWSLFLHADQRAVLREGAKEPEPALAFAESLLTSFEADFTDLQDLDRLLDDCSMTERQGIDLLRPYIQPDVREEDFLAQIRNTVYLTWIEQAEKQTPILAEVSARSWNRKQREYTEKVAGRRQKVNELIQRRLKENIIGRIEYNRLGNPVTYRTIQHQVRKKRLIWSVRKLVATCWEEGLSELAPCWLASPESASAIFPMRAGFFDVVIFDEASQCFVERGVPVLLRGKQGVVAGDDKQLPPLDLYRVRYEDAEAEFVESEIALEVESLLDLARNRFAEAYLSWHYRSQEEELINFSNHAFYEGKLQVLPPAQPDPLNMPPLEWISVKGLWASNRNQPEAERVIQLILQLIQRQDEPSIGVVTFNYHQQELIKDLLDQKLEELVASDEAQYHQLFHALYKTEQEEFQGLFVKNIENVQGDERDIIIFSVGYAPNEKGRLSTQFGLLSQEGGQNRLNVAISRARKKIYVLCSFQPSDLKVDGAKNDGPRYFRDYLHYVKAISESRTEEALHLLNRQHTTDLTRLPENSMADHLAEVIREAGYHVERHVGDTSYKLDLAVKQKPGDKKYLLGIECEGTYYFSGESAKERELYRMQLLEDRSWQVYRVWARNFWLRREKEVEKILKLLV